jgi:hypothetical protein
MMSGSFDRRHFHRTGIDEHAITSAHVRPGHLVAVIDVSTGGALIEMSQRLLPGAAVDLRLETTHRRTSLHGRVLRCAVIRLHPTAVFYRAAIAFDRQWPGFVESERSEYPVPAGEDRPTPTERVSSTQGVA